MKKILLMLMMAVLITACSKDKDEPIDDAQAKWNTYVNVRPDESFKLKAKISGLTPAEIVEQSFSMTFKTHWWTFGYSEEYLTPNRGTPEFMKDYENNIIRMWATDILKENEEGETVIEPHFINAFDVYLTNEAGDTIAYIANESLEIAKELIEIAFENGDYDEVNRLFDEAYTYKAIED